jgi:lipoate-protein ligase A
VQALRSFNVFAETVMCGHEKTLGPYLCFQHQTPGDLVIAGHKVMGSAQRRPHGALMQHGSILLKTSAMAPMLPGVTELTGIEVGVDELIEAIGREFKLATGWLLAPGELTAQERTMAQGLIESKYGHDEWNKKR